MRPENREHMHPQGVRRCVPRCCAATHNRQSSVLSPQSSERGSTLVISLIILIVLMLLGVMAMNTSDTQYKLAGNLQFEDVAMSNAEQAVDAAERWLEMMSYKRDSCRASVSRIQLLLPASIH